MERLDIHKYLQYPSGCNPALKVCQVPELNLACIHEIMRKELIYLESLFVRLSTNLTVAHSSDCLQSRLFMSGLTVCWVYKAYHSTITERGYLVIADTTGGGGSRHGWVVL